MTGLDVEAVLSQHLGDGSDDCDECCASATVDEYIAHVAAVLRVEIESALGDALREAADNMPLRREGQPYEHAANWLRRRSELCYPYRPTLAATEGD